MATDVKERISGAAYNKMRALERKAKDLRTKFGDWQVGFFEPGQPLEEYYPDQIQFVHGIIFDFGGFRTSRPIGRIPIEIQRVAMQKQREIDALHSELEEVLYKVAHKLSIKKGRTIYQEQINPQTGEIGELPPEVRSVDINIDETDEETMAELEAKKQKSEKVKQLFTDTEKE